MAIFEKQNELQQQDRYRNFTPTKGWKKGALAVLGYNADGTKNTFGKYLGHGNVLLDHYVPQALAEGDTKEVIASGEEEEWGHQMASFNVAKNFIGGGGGAAGGMMGGESGGNGGGGMASMFGQGGGGAGGNGSMMGNTMNAAMGGSGGSNSMQSKMGGATNSMFGKSGNNGVDTMNSDAAMKSANDGLDKGIDDSDILNEIDDPTNYENYSTEADYKAANGIDSGVSSETKTASAIGDAGGSIPILGDVAKSFQAKFAAADVRDKKKKSMMRQTVNSGDYNYL